MIGSLILISVIVLIGIFAYHYSVRGPIDLTEYTEKEINDGIELYTRWISYHLDGVPFGTLKVNLDEGYMTALEKTMNVEFAAAVSRHTKYPMYLTRSGTARVKIKKA